MSGLSPKAERLRVRMSGLWVRAYGQDWADHLEYALWQDRYAANVDPVRMDRPVTLPGMP